MICADENQFGIIRFEQIFHKVTYFNLANPLEKVMIQCIFSFSTDSNYVKIKKFARDYFSKFSSIIT
ncbi:hypothetical protein T03_13889 [Trichinella britovi]|uniref:Uncharacterized protein n=1 Tax=Trichinella britovi TaxID=45882 RepID=A0A0V1DIG7_TRIBR|nr:hypothetical protein T03_13889 [Trichinella britovi]